jgi:Mg2+ and Co2+ transporter CorA
MTTDGKITERENVELAEDAKDEKVEKLPEDMASIAGEDIGGGEGSDEIDEEVEPITEDMGKKYEDMAYRISEMEKKIQSMEEAMKPSEDIKEEEIKMEEEELPKLDGAPIDENTSANASKEKQKFGKKVASAQNTFLSKLYK